MAKLFSAINFGAFALAHRVIQPGVIDYRQFATGEASVASIANLCARCVQPGGLLVLPPTPVSAAAAAPPFIGTLEAGDLRDDWQGLADLAHARDATVLARLWHAGAFAATPDHKAAGGTVPARAEGPASLDRDGIDRVIAQYQAAAGDARGAGCDGVELDAADGSLVDQFLQDGTNRRQDLYGGSVGKRLTFLVDLTDALIHEWGAGRVGVRLSPFGRFRGMRETAPTVLFCGALAALAEREVAFVHLVRTAADGRPLGHRPYPPDAASGFRSAFPGVIIVSGAFTRRGAIDLVERRWADAIGVASGSLAAAAT